MSSDETNAYLQAKLQQAQGQSVNEQSKLVQPTKAKGTKAKTQPEEQPQPPVDMQAIRQMLEDVVHAELQTIRIEQPQPLDMQALQKVVQSVVRAELQTVQTTLTILVNAIQAQTDALLRDEVAEGEGEEDDSLPTASPRHTDDNLENELVYPPDGEGEELDAERDEEGDTDEGEGEGEEEEGYSAPLPCPVPPTHKLRVLGPVGLLLGDGITPRHPSQGTRRWEPQYEQ